MNRHQRFRTHSNSPKQQRNGSIVVLTAVSLVVLLIFAAFLVDIAWMATIESEAQLASDISTRGAMNAFVNDRSNDSYDARVAKAQAVGETLFENIVVGRGPLDIDPKSFVFGVRDDNGNFTASTNKFANAVELDLPNVKPDGFGLFLAPLFGVDHFNTSPSTTVASSSIDVVLCLDISRSMAWRLDANQPPASIGTIDAPPVEGSRWIALVDSVNKFLQQAEVQSPSLRISLVTLGGGVFKRVPTQWDTTTTRVQNEFDFIGAAVTPIETSLNEISSGVLAWQTTTSEALQLTRTTFQNESDPSTEKICILLSDGLATTGSPVAAADALGGDGVTIHTIYFAGDPKGIPQLQSVANSGGGLFLNADNETQLDNAFGQILTSLSVSIVD